MEVHEKMAVAAWTLVSAAAKTVRRWYRTVSRNPQRYAKRVSAAFGKAVFLFLTASLIASFSFFDSEEAFWSFSRDIFYRVFAPVYPGTQDRAATVVMLTDDYFRKFDTYPVKYGTHAMILRALASYSPRAVFVDFAFIDERPDSTIDDLKHVLEEFYNRGIPVYVPTHGAAADGSDPGIRADLAKLAEGGRIRLVSFDLGRIVWGAPVYALHSAVEKKPTASAHIVQDFFPQLFAKIKGIPEFEIWWGLPPAPSNCLRAQDPCGARYNIFGRLWATMNVKILPFNMHFGSEMVEIPYAPVVYAEELEVNRGGVESQLRSKFVFYGADLAILRDSYPNPVYSYRSGERMLPGIFFHAMALENMIDLQDRIKVPRETDHAAVWRRDVVSIGIICFALFVYRTFATVQSRLRDTFVVVLAAVATAATEFFYFNFAPSNWIGVFSFVTVAHVSHADEAFHNLVRRFSRRHATQG